VPGSIISVVTLHSQASTVSDNVLSLSFSPDDAYGLQERQVLHMELQKDLKAICMNSKEEMADDCHKRVCLFQLSNLSCRTKENNCSSPNLNLTTDIITRLLSGSSHATSKMEQRC
jgi:hypothetical protein